VVNNDQTRTQEDEVIFSAEYSFPRVLTGTVLFGFCLFLVIGAAYLDLLRKDYTGAGLLLFLALISLYGVLDLIFFGELRFYHDRVTGLSLFGRKTIYYSTASVEGPFNLCHTIFQSKENGKRVRMRLPTVYHSLLFPSATARQIETIMDYLTQDKNKNPRKFKKTTLPREIIRQQV